MLDPDMAHRQDQMADSLSEAARQSAAEARLLRLVADTVQNVPAYRRFLESHGLDGSRTIGLGEFVELPLLNKANYVHAFPLPERCHGGDIARCDRLAVSTGSTGVPVFWPRAAADETEVTDRFEQVFRLSFQAHERRTLAVVCFPMGNWVGGLYTTSCCWHLAGKAYPLTVATPGNRVDEILRVIGELGRYFEQTVLLGYPPFVKDVVDSGVAAGLDWTRYAIRFVFAGEVFSEEWRTLMGERVGSTDHCHDSASLYGTADGGVLGNETPLSVAIRRFLAQNPAAARAIFGESRLPTLVQYDPLSRYFEVVDGTLVLSCDNGVPLIRYHIADRGGLIGFRAMLEFLGEWGFEAGPAAGLRHGEPLPPLPFVWVFGRADFTVSYYGANIYPENVAVGLEQGPLIRWVTGKFVMEVRTEPDGSEYFHIAVERTPGGDGPAELAALLAESIQVQVARLNSEFAHYVPADRQRPCVELRSFGDPQYFPIGVKHRYTKSKGAA